MHDSLRVWVAVMVERYELKYRPTLEVGAAIVNGTVRDLFEAQYVGCDIVRGTGVDVLANAEDLSAWNDDHWPTVISTEMLEHCARPWVAVKEMARVCMPDGYVVITCRGYDRRGYWEVHDHPHDYWRYSDGAMRVLADDAGLTVLELDPDPEGPGWLMVCQK